MKNKNHLINLIPSKNNAKKTNRWQVVEKRIAFSKSAMVKWFWQKLTKNKQVEPIHLLKSSPRYFWCQEMEKIIKNKKHNSQKSEKFFEYRFRWVYHTVCI